MLKGVSPLLGPDLLHAMMAMGHCDGLLIADAHYPSFGSPARVIRMDGVMIPQLLAAVLTVFPLDVKGEWNCAVMENPGGVSAIERYRAVIAASGEKVMAREIERFSFYDLGKAAYAVVITGDITPRGNLLLKKGVVNT